jgi:hypothetical protein
MPLIRYLVIEGRRYGWKICVGSMFTSDLFHRIKQEKFSNDVVFIEITDYRQCHHAIRKADLIIASLPHTMLLQIADLCIRNKKSLITPNKLTRQMLSRKSQVEEAEILLLMECGFSPGLDHVTAKKAIDRIHLSNGHISSFKTYSGGMVAEDGVDNPWRFRFTEPVSDIIHLGRYNNRHVIDGKTRHIPYHQLFARTSPVVIQGWNNLVSIPAGDALYYKKIYQLDEADTVVKGKILNQEFADTWNLLVKLGLTDMQSKIEMSGDASFYNLVDSLLPYGGEATVEERLQHYLQATTEDITRLKWIGLLGNGWVRLKEPTPAAILQHVLEEKLQPQEQDKDHILMQHHLEYTLKHTTHNVTATLVAAGENNVDSALAKAMGLTTGAAAKAFLLDNIKIRGMHIPVMPEVYEPVLNELLDLGVAFHVDEQKTYHDEPEELQHNFSSMQRVAACG